MIEFTIHGKPIAMQRHRSFLRHGKIHMFNPQDKIKKNIKTELIRITNIENPLENFINLSLDFFVGRPKSHFRLGKYAELLKKDAPLYPRGRPDLDNYIKFYMDVFNGILYKDDSQVISVFAHKRYCQKNDARTEVWLCWDKT